MQAEHEIALDQLTYRYPKASESALSGINPTISVDGCFGLVGSAGAGKTALVDVILGLLRPTEGGITTDGEPVTDEDLRAWRSALRCIAQDICLTDTAFTESIAFWINPEPIDPEQVKRCARMTWGMSSARRRCRGPITLLSVIAACAFWAGSDSAFGLPGASSRPGHPGI